MVFFWFKIDGFSCEFSTKKFGRTDIQTANAHICLYSVGEGKAKHAHCTYSYLYIMTASLIQPLKPANSLHEIMNLRDFIQLEFRCNQHSSDTRRLSIEIL